MPDWKNLGGVKVEWAKTKLDKLQVAIMDFGQAHPNPFVEETDPQTGDLVVRANIPDPVPIEWGLAAGDIVHNLRSSLDIMWRRLTYPGGGGESDHQCAFRIFGSSEKFERTHGGNRVVKGARKPMMDIYKALKPYQSGNDLLWLLEQMDIADKHRRLIPAYAALLQPIPLAGAWIEETPDGGITFSVGVRSDVRLARQVGKCPIDNGTEVLRIPAAQRPPKVAVKDQVMFTIAFNEPGIIQRNTVLDTLHQLVGVTEDVIKLYVDAGLLA